MRITDYLKKYWYRYLFAVTALSIAVILDMLNPQITKHIIDDVIDAGEIGKLPRLLLGIFLIALGRCIFGYVKEYTFDSTSSRISVDIRKKLFQHMQTLSISFYDKNNTGELMSRVKDDVDRIWDAFNYVSMLLIEVLLHTVLILYCMFQLSNKLFIIPLITIPMVGTLAIIMERRLGGIYEEISEENATLNTIAQENLSGVRTVKAFSREKFEIQKFLSHNKKYYDLNMRQSKVFIKYQPIFQFITRLVPLVSIVYGGFLTIKGEISLGTLGAFVEYSNNLTWPMEMVGWLTNSAASAVASNKKIQRIFREKPEIIEVKEPVILDRVKGDIAFHHVSLELEGKKILKDINFEMKAGQTIGIMGATGAGKTSIINLLKRLYDVTEGEILLDGVDIRNLSLTQLRGNISLVMQDVFLFSDTINENVRMGKKDSMEHYDVLEAIERASAAEFVERLEKKTDTMIGERGVGLSGGQKQRISIARALAKKAPILVLDDSTSALDMETEHQIQETLNQLEGTSKIIIAHRISAVRNADEIIFLENGRIVERGTHKELLSKKGEYYQTFVAQYNGELAMMQMDA